METIFISREVYSLEPLLKTAYSFTDRVYIHLSQDDQHWIINWEPKNSLHLEAGEFENELIQQQTRYILEQKTADVRKMIIARALASTIIDRSDDEAFSQFAEETQNENEADEILKGWHEVHDHV